MKFHVIKASRKYDGFPYCGPSSDYLPTEYETREAAEAAVTELTKRNPVGWDIYEVKWNNT